MRLYMMIGLPFSGKSTYAKTLPGFLHSTEKLRIKHPDLSETQIWELMEKNTRLALQAKADVVCDASNITRKRRRQMLATAKKLGAKTIAVLMLTPIDRCKERAIKNGVSPEVIEKCARAFNMPAIPEFDDIRIVQFEIGDDDIELDFSQDNGYHAFTLLKHMQLTKEYLQSEDPVLITAAANHDVGKVFTKAFVDSKGEKTEEAHYYGHENYGAIWYLTTRKANEFDLNVAQYINYHMRPFVWDKSEKAKEKDIEDWGENFVKNLEILHAADLQASK